MNCAMIQYNSLSECSVYCRNTSHLIPFQQYLWTSSCLWNSSLPVDCSREHLQCWVSGTNGRPLMSTNYIPDVTADEVQEQQPPKHLATSKGSDSSQLLARVDSASGITHQQFQKLFKKCSLCGSVMTCWAFHDHGCVVIDLTTDSD